MTSDPCLDAALAYVKQHHGTSYTGLLPRAFYFQLRLNGRMDWPKFRSSALPTFPSSPNNKPK